MKGKETHKITLINREMEELARRHSINLAITPTDKYILFSWYNPNNTRVIYRFLHPDYYPEDGKPDLRELELLELDKDEISYLLGGEIDEH